MTPSPTATAAKGRARLESIKASHARFVWGEGTPDSVEGCRCGAASWPCRTNEARLIAALEEALDSLEYDYEAHRVLAKLVPE